MMEEGPRRRARLPWGLAGMIGLVVLVEGFLAHHPDRFGLPSWGDWSSAAHAARDEAIGAEVLLFGDSQVKLGVQPRVMEARLGGRVRSLAVSAGPSPASYFLLKRALEAGASPSAVVVSFHPHLLQEGPRHTITYWPELLNLREAFELSRTARDPSLLAEIALGRLIPSIGGRHEVRDAIASALIGQPKGRTDAMLASWRNWNANRGGFLMGNNPNYRGEVAPVFASLFPPSWKPDPASASYLRRFLRLARSRKIPVVWLIPPFVPEAQSRRENLGLDAGYTAFAKAVQREFPEVTVIDARHSGYQATEFADPVHLNRRGAVAMTEELAEVVAQGLTAGRWVVLPLYREHPERTPLEDASQSTLALKNLGPRVVR